MAGEELRRVLADEFGGVYAEHDPETDNRDWLLPRHRDYVCQNCGAVVCGQYRAAHKVACTVKVDDG